MMGRPYVHRAHERGFSVTVLDHPRGLAPEPVRAMWRGGDQTYEVVGGSDEAWYRAASAAVRDQVPHAVVAFSEPHVVAAALVADELGVPSPGLHAVTVSRNKALQRELFGRHGIRQPTHHLAVDLASAQEWAKSRYPVVAKPLSESGSKGVQVINGEDDLKAWFADQGQDRPFLCEEYVDGPEYSCELVVYDGTTVFSNITAKVTTPPPYCVELAHRVPAGCDPVTAEAIRAQAIDVAKAMGLRFGVAHVECRVGSAGPYLMEVAVRTPGDHIFEMIELATGVDLYDAVLACAVGERPNVAPTRSGAACVWYPEFAPGTRLPLEALRAAAEIPGVARADIPSGPDRAAAPLRWSLDRSASFVLHASGPAELDALLERVRATVAVDDV